MPPHTFREGDERTRRDFERLFEGRGGPKHFWCMAWRPIPVAVRTGPASGRKRAIRKAVREGVPVGILGYDAGEPVAWCSVAPRSTYRPLGGPPARDESKVWPIVCFFVRRDLRGQGLGPQLLDAAIATARRHGATIVEAYPVAPDAPSYRHMGFVPMFAAAGFKKVGVFGVRTSDTDLAS
ncbi:MAG: GNAT family N-acetyltransferase [Alphaproteobacteria bacterium]|nr:GNAT family N-acetyltransferase [Alphaproteobacteria bacterium]